MLAGAQPCDCYSVVARFESLIQLQSWVADSNVKLRSKPLKHLPISVEQEKIFGHKVSQELVREMICSERSFDLVDFSLRCAFEIFAFIMTADG